MSTTRFVDGRICAKVSCGAAITPSQPAVVFATDCKRLAFWKKQDVSKKVRKRTADFEEEALISWTNQQNFMHRTCWDSIYSAATASTTTRKRRRVQIEARDGKEEGEPTLVLNKFEQELILTASDNIEFYDSIEEIESKAAKVAELLSTAKHVVAFTGAGISVSAGIADYRGTAGIDTKKYLGQHAGIENNTGHRTNDEKHSSTHNTSAPTDDLDDSDGDNDGDDLEYEKLEPTFAHNALTTLLQRGRLHYVITQNCDGLDVKAGIPRDRLSELHGNVFVEYCEKCGTEYYRDFAVDLYSTNCYKEPWYKKCSRCKLNHYTGRKCSIKSCQGKLRDTIVNFGDILHEDVCGGLERATQEAREADLVLCLGSSLTVTPASELPTMSATVVIVNLQRTDFDDRAAVRVFGTCDMFMKAMLVRLSS